MRTLLIAGLALVVGAGCAHSPDGGRSARLIPTLRPYVEGVAEELHQVPAARKPVLDEIAGCVAERLAEVRRADLVFICTHNSRRSHMSQIWAQTAATYYGLEKVRAFSGGTETTECNCRTVTAMRRAGFEIEDATTGDNPVYLVTYAAEAPPIRAYSKIYNADDNPRTGFIALMTCSAADQSCPVVEGAVARFAIHYADPRLCDDTPTETTAYNERCREISREMFYLMSEVRRLARGR